MADRLKALRRIEAVQAEMIRLAQWRLAGAEAQARELARKAERLRDYAAGTPAAALDAVMGATLARAALRSLGDVARAQAVAERDRDAQRTTLDALRRRDGALGAAVQRAAGAARRTAEARDLAATVEAWLAIKPADEA